MALIDNIKTYKKMVIEIDEPITDKVIAVQEDAESRYLDVQLFKDGVSFDLTGTKVRICMVKPDGKDVMNDGEITDPNSGRCQFLFTTQMLAACGVLQTQIIVFSESEEQILSTQIFNIYVTKKLLTNETIESTNEYGSLVVLFQDIYEALQIMTAIRNNFGEPGQTAQRIDAETFWQMLEAVYNVNAEALKNASVSEVLDRIGTTSDSGATDTTGTLMGKVNNIMSGANTVKSVQTIYISQEECDKVELVDTTKFAYLEKTISPVNLEKSLIFSNDLRRTTDNIPFAKFKDENTIIVYASTKYNSTSPQLNRVYTAYIQIIEFN